jgi:hypothetical protein
LERIRVPPIILRILVLAVALTATLFALDPAKTLTQYAHRIWGHEEGLVQPTVFSIVQTRDGFLKSGHKWTVPELPLCHSA